MGDPLVDHWTNDTEWHVTPGGAYNTLSNIKALIRSNKLENHIQLRSYFYELNLDISPLMEANKCGFPVKQYNCNKKWQILSTVDSRWHNIDCTDVVFKPLENTYNYNILVVSDYNKGFVTQHLPELASKVYDLCIVDSRYGNTDFNLLRDISGQLIWRRTKNSDTWVEFDWDFCLESNGPEDTFLICKSISMDNRLKCPINQLQEVVCSIGCGDTFTATLATSLAQFISKEGTYEYDVHGQYYTRPVNLQHLWKAVDLAHGACQEVVSQPRTSIAKNITIN